MRYTIAVLVLLAACSKAAPTAPVPPPPPTGIDPTVLVVNDANQGMSLTWWAQSGLMKHDSIIAGTKGCFVFFSASPTDSVRFMVVLGDSTKPGAQWSWSPWFDPKTGLIPSIDSASAKVNYPYGAEWWIVRTTGNYTFLMTTDSTAPCTP